MSICSYFICTVKSTSQHLNRFVLLFLNDRHQNQTSLFKMSPQLASVDFPSSKHYIKTLTYLSVEVQQLATKLTIHLIYMKLTCNKQSARNRKFNYILIRVFLPCCRKQCHFSMPRWLTSSTEQTKSKHILRLYPSRVLRFKF